MKFVAAFIGVVVSSVLAVQEGTDTPTINELQNKDPREIVYVKKNADLKFSTRSPPVVNYIEHSTKAPEKKDKDDKIVELGKPKYNQLGTPQVKLGEPMHQIKGRPTAAKYQIHDTHDLVKLKTEKGTVEDRSFVSRLSSKVGHFVSSLGGFLSSSLGESENSDIVTDSHHHKTKCERVCELKGNILHCEAIVRVSLLAKCIEKEGKPAKQVTLKLRSAWCRTSHFFRKLVDKLSVPAAAKLHRDKSACREAEAHWRHLGRENGLGAPQRGEEGGIHIMRIETFGQPEEDDEISSFQNRQMEPWGRFNPYNHIFGRPLMVIHRGPNRHERMPVDNMPVDSSTAAPAAPLRLFDDEYNRPAGHSPPAKGAFSDAVRAKVVQKKNMSEYEEVVTVRDDNMAKEIEEARFRNKLQRLYNVLVFAFLGCIIGLMLGASCLLCDKRHRAALRSYTAAVYTKQPVRTRV